MAVRVKREPGSPGTALDAMSAQQRICYVCGGPGAAYPLNCRPRDRAGSYFSFLEQHDAPQGARRPTADGVVLACMLCFSFLNQQWESYERNHTPHSKRLYWLKRADNGHYIGAEMRLQGEYASQIIGVSPEPGLSGGPHGHCSQLAGTGGGSSIPSVSRPTSGSSGRNSVSVPLSAPPLPYQPPPPHHHHHHHHPHHQHRSVSTPQMADEYRQSRDRCDNRSGSVLPLGASEDQEESYDSGSMLLDLRSNSGGPTANSSPPSSSAKEGHRRGSRSRDHSDRCDGLSGRKKSEEAVFGGLPANDALDLSMPDKNAATEACYLCGEEVLRGTLVSVFAKQISNCPFFPSLMLHPRPSRSRPMDPAGCVQACAPCYQHLLQQWDVFQRQNVPHPERRYQLWKRTSVTSRLSSSRSSTPASPPPLLPPQPPPSSFICFLCGQEFPWNLRHILYSGPNAEGEPPLPFLERFKPSRGALPLSPSGQVLACSECYKAIHRQRHAYMDALRSASIVEESAPPPLPPPPSLPSRSRGLQSAKVHHDPSEQRGDAARGLSMSNSGATSAEVSIACHVCHLPVPRRHLKFSDVLLTKDAGHGFFPNTIQDDGDGFPICMQCCSSLLSQFDAFEEERVPYHQRRYALPPLPHSPFATEDRRFSPALRLSSRDSFGGMTPSSDLMLRIRVPSPEQDVLNPLQPGPHMGAPLLTTVSTTSDSPVSTISVGRHSTVHSAPPLSTVYSNVLDLSSGSSNPLPGRSVLQQPCVSTSPIMASTTSNAPGFRSARSKPPNLSTGKSFVCYVCGLGSTGNQAYTVRSYPPKPVTSSGDSDASSSSQQAFFPFLTLHPAPPDSDPVAEDGTVITCTFCYHSLMVQWLAYEASRHPPDHNPWSRTYNCHDYVCYVCGVTTYRKRVKAISVADFPFLVDHVRHHGSLVLDGGDGVTVCLMCYETLSAQWNDFERMKVPLELRKYNWITAPPPPEDEEPPLTMTSQNLMNGENLLDHPSAASIDDDNDSSVTSGPSRRDSLAGLVHGAKQLPPLSTSSLPSGNVVVQKAVIRTSATAAVPSLSQVSPGSSVVGGGGGTSGNSNARTSSFAAALRKLAEQATEPISSDKDQSPATSPCPTPTSSKRVQSSSLVHAANSHASSTSAHTHSLNSSFSSPPAVTLASSQPQHGYIDEQKNLERSNIVQSREAAKSLYEETRKSNHSNHRSHSDVSREDGHGNSSTVRSSSSSSYIERREIDASSSKATSLQGFLSGHSNSEASSVKVPGSTPSSGYYGDRGREEHPFTVNGLTNSHHLQQLSRSQHHATAVTAPRLEDPHLSASSSFQPYRSSSEDVRHALQQHVPSTYDTTSPYGYPAAFLPPHLSHPSFRIDDQMYLERLALLRSPMFNLPHPGVLPPHHVMPFIPGARYPPEFLTHPLSLVSPTSHHLLAQERFKLEEQHQQRRERELELYQEQERRRECDRERERDKEREQRESTNEGLVVPREQEKELKSHWQSSSYTRRSESPVRGAGVGSITQGTPRDLVIRNSSSAPRQAPTSSSSSPPSMSASGPDSFLSKSSLGLNSQSWSTHGFLRPPSTATEHLSTEDGRDSDRDAIHPKAYPPISYSLGHSPASEHEKSRDRIVVVDALQACESTVEASNTSRSLQQLPFLGNSKMHLSSSVSQRHYQSSDSPGFDRFHRVHLESASSHETFSANREGSRQALATPPESEPERKSNHNSQYRIDAIITNHHVDHEIRIVPKSEHRPKGGAISRCRESVTGIGEAADLNDNNVPWCSRFNSSGLPVDRSGMLDGCATTNRSAVPSLAKSKLDLAAEKARLKNRSIDDDWSDDDVLSEKQRWSHLAITSGPPLPLDVSKGKLAFLAKIGLTTQKQRKEIEFDSYMKRAQRLRELGVSPVQRAVSSETLSIPWFLNVKRMSSRYSSDELCREPDFKEKVQFLQQLNLYPVPRNQRDELEQILKVVIDEKIRRNGHVFPAHYKLNRPFQRDENHPPNHHLNSAEFKDLVNKGTKRKVEESSIASPNGDQPLSKRVKSLLASSRRKLSTLSGRNHSLSSGDLSGSGLVLPIVMGPTNKDAVAVPCTLDGNSVSASVISYNSKNDDAAARAVRQLYGRDFAQEFHESVLLQTKQQQLKDSVRIGEVKLEAKLSKESDSLLVSESRKRDTIASPGAPVSHEKHHKSSHSILRWPGIESLMEAYERHQQEQKLEKEVLLDQCSRLKAHNQDLSNIAEKLSQTMAELIHTKKDLDEERQHHHQAIDNLKCILKQLR